MTIAHCTKTTSVHGPMTQRMRMRLRRAVMTVEQKELAREKARIRERTRTAAMTSEQKERRRCKARERARKIAAEKTKVPRKKRVVKRRPGQETIRPPPAITTPIMRKMTMTRMARRLGGDPISLFLDYKTVLEFIALIPNINTKITKLAHIIGELRDDPLYAEAVKEYRAVMSGLHSSRREQVGENQKSARDLKGWLEWPQILEVASRPTLDKFETAALALYTQLHPRRGEYRTLFCVRELPTEDVLAADKTANYLVLPDDKAPYALLQKYKTSGSKGSYRLEDIPKCVADLGRERMGGYLFEYRCREQSAWSAFIVKIFLRETGQRASINILRKAYVSWHLGPSSKPISENQKVLMAHHMGTSVQMLMSAYRKVA